VTRGLRALAASLLLALVAACGHVGPLAPPANGNGGDMPSAADPGS